MGRGWDAPHTLLSPPPDPARRAVDTGPGCRRLRLGAARLCWAPPSRFRQGVEPTLTLSSHLNHRGARAKTHLCSEKKTVFWSLCPQCGNKHPPTWGRGAESRSRPGRPSGSGLAPAKAPANPAILQQLRTLCSPVRPSATGPCARSRIRPGRPRAPEPQAVTWVAGVPARDRERACTGPLTRSGSRRLRPALQ